MFGLGSFNLIKEFERASNEPNAEQLANSSAQLQPNMSLLLKDIFEIKLLLLNLEKKYKILFF